MDLSEESKDKIIQFLRKEFSPLFIYLFGSFAKGEGRSDSDIDLAIYTENIIDSYTLLMAAGTLSFEVKRDIQIVGTKEVLYCNDDYVMGNFDIKTFKKYAKLNEERKIILDAIEEDGRIY